MYTSLILPDVTTDTKYFIILGHVAYVTNL